MRGSTKSIVAESAGVPIYADGNIKAISFANSPYYAHAHLAAIDLYPIRKDEFVPSPVRGRVIGVRSVKAPYSKHFKADEDEKLLLIANNEELTTKILHLKPTVGVGDRVEVSDPIGRYVRSGFFNFWTGHHVHVEIRPANDAIRARGSFPMAPKLLTQDNIFEKRRMDPRKIPCEVVVANPEFLLLKPPSSMIGTLGGYVGLRAVTSETNAILDGGFPHYREGGILVQETSSLRAGSPVKIGDLVVGEISAESPHQTKIGHNYVRTTFRTKLSIRVSQLLIRGLSLALSLSSLNTLLLRAVPNFPLRKKELSAIEHKGVLSLSYF